MKILYSEEDIRELFVYSVYDFDKQYFSTEAYFRKGVSLLAEKLEDFIADLRKIYNDSIINSKNKDVTKKIISSKANEINAIVEKHEKILEKVMNCEKVNIGLSYVENAYCIPLFFDENLVKENPNSIANKKTKKNNDKYIVDIDFKNKLSDIAETSNGFRFKNSKNIKLIFVFGFGLFEKLSNSECVAILLHEFGHSLQQMLVSASMNFYTDVKMLAIENLYSGLLNIGEYSFSNKDLSESKKKEKTKTDDELAQPYLGKLVKNGDRNEVIDDINRESDEILKILIAKGDEIFAEKNPIGEFIKKSFIGFFEIIYKILTSPVSFLAGIFKRHVIRTHKDFLIKNLRYEQFADYMAVQNGYGSYLTEALSKISIEEGRDYGLANLVYLVPLLNVAITYFDYQDLKHELLIHGYSTTLERYEAIYRSLKYELNNNKNLTKEDIKAIKSELEAVERVYRAEINKKGLRYFLIKFYYKITRRTIDRQNGGANIENNVLIPLNETIDEYCKENNV